MPRFAPADTAYGKLPVDKSALRRAFKLRYFVDSDTAPESDLDALRGTGAQKLVSRWSAFGSDKTNSSVFAALANGAIAAGNTTGDLVDFTDEKIAIDYAAASGYAAGDESTDAGVTIASALDYWRKEGIAEYSSSVSYIAGYAALKPRDTDELLRAVRMFGWAVAGLKVYKRAENRYKNADSEGMRGTELPAWDENMRGVAAGWVAVPIVGVDEDGNLVAVLWGRVQRITPGYYAKHSDEAWAVVTYGALTGEKPVAGFRSASFARAVAKRSQSADGPRVRAGDGSAIYAGPANAEVLVDGTGSKRRNANKAGSGDTPDSSSESDTSHAESETVASESDLDVSFSANGSAEATSNAAPAFSAAH